MVEARVQTQGITAQLARFAAQVRYEALPPSVVKTVKAMLLDSLGTALAANTLGEGCAELVAVARDAGGAAESTIIGFGDKAPALMAALVNGGLAHALNYDAVGAGHLGVIPTAPLAAAERAHADGRVLLAALAAGCETTARLAAAVRNTHGVNDAVLEGQVLGYFGAATGAGRVLGLDEHQMQSALGLAVMQAAGSRQISVVGGEPPAKAIYGAFPNHGGMLSALLAQKGLGAECDAIEGKAGLFALFYDNAHDPEAPCAALGERYELERVSFKPWPASGNVNPFIEAALDLVQRHHVKPSEIERVHMRGGTGARGWLEPAEERKRPQNGAAAGNSVYFGVAKALVNGTVRLADFTEAGLKQPEVLRLGGRMDHTIEAELGSSAIVEVTLRSGEQHTSRVDAPLGHPSKPMSRAQLEGKFRDCATYATTSLSSPQLDEAIQLIDHLEDVADVSRLPALLGGQRG